MDEQEAITALGHLIGVTNGWNDSTNDYYMQQLVELDSPEALTAACISIGRSWDQLGRPPLKVILDSYDREVEFSTSTRGIEPHRVHCDGSGVIMVHPDDGRPAWGRPCPRCSPVLASVIADRDRAELYVRGGAALEHVSDAVERVSGRLRYRNGFRPPHCHRADDPDDPPVTDAGRGVAIARKAYLDDRADQSSKGLDDARVHFDELIGAVPGAAVARARRRR